MLWKAYYDEYSCIEPVPGYVFRRFGASILKKAQEKGAVKLEVTDIRTFSGNKHNQVDDYPYGGGAGMVLKPEPMFSAVEAITADKQPRIILMCPQGERFTQKSRRASAGNRVGVLMWSL